MDLQSFKEARSVVFMLLPYSIGISLIISLFASYIYAKKITKPIKEICNVTKDMKILKEDAYCDINTGDEIELLSHNINSLYNTLLDTIDSLKTEIENVSKSEKSKVDFLRSASHELKTPLMSIHIMLENMILNIGKYKNHDIYLEKCKEVVNQLSKMVQEILDTSRLNTLDNKNEKIAILKGVAFRVIADAYLEDLEVVKVSDIKQILIDPTVENLIYKSVRSAQDREKKMNRAVPKLQANPNVYGIPGKVLQIDGDKEYLKICLDVYTELGIPAVVVAIPEENQYKEIINLLEKHNPDILVVTGHDALTSRKGNITDLNNYRNSLNFIKAVKQARKWEPNLDNLVIFAGACQSNYEQLIRAGANYASSPGRIMIHALDPVFIVEKIACSRIDVVVPIEEILDQTITGVKGIGGFETRGRFRWAMPRPLL